MTCENCKKAMRERKATNARPYEYSMSGLDNVVLVGITVYRCSRCGEESPVIPRVGELNVVIATQIALKPSPLCGQEVRFLRKIAGFRAKQFAALIGTSASHLSRVENGKTSTLGPSSDRLARAVSMAARDGDSTRKVLLQLAEAIEVHKFRLVSNRWQTDAA